MGEENIARLLYTESPGSVDLARLFDKLPARDVRLLNKIVTQMVEWNLTFPRAVANATVFFTPSGGDQEFEDFERSMDHWIEMGRRYG